MGTTFSLYIRQVLEALWEVGLTAKPKKYTWGARTVEYLEHEVGNGIVKVPEVREKAIAEYIRSDYI